MRATFAAALARIRRGWTCRLRIGDGTCNVWRFGFAHGKKSGTLRALSRVVRDNDELPGGQRTNKYTAMPQNHQRLVVIALRRLPRAVAS